MYGHKGDFVSADTFFNKSLPLLKKYGSAKHIATAYNNYAIIKTKQGNTKMAIAYYEKAIQIFDELDLIKEKSKAMNNLADGYRNDGQYIKAKQVLDKCIKINTEHNYLKNLYVNYENMSAVLDLLGDYKVSILYLQEYYNLKDSLLGAEIQNNIAKMNAQYEMRQQELQIIEKELAIENVEKVNKYQNIIILLLLFGIGLLFVLFYRKIIGYASNLKRSRSEISTLNKNNEDKSTQISELNKAIQSFRSVIHKKPIDEPAADIINPYKPILTQEDWMAFKSYFTTKYPNNTNRLRIVHPDLTQAEERFFLLTKLNLHNKEISSILGIASESVKKSRSRLKKKLNIKIDSKLEEYIAGFK